MLIATYIASVFISTGRACIHTSSGCVRHAPAAPWRIPPKNILVSWFIIFRSRHPFLCCTLMPIQPAPTLGLRDPLFTLLHATVSALLVHLNLSLVPMQQRLLRPLQKSSYNTDSATPSSLTRTVSFTASSANHWIFFKSIATCYPATITILCLWSAYAVTKTKAFAS